MAHLTSSYRRRICISAVTTATSSTADVEWDVPAALTEFWDTIDASGYGIRVTKADGVTAISYAWSGFNKTNKTGTLQLDGAPTPITADKCVMYWVYYDIDSPTDGSSAVTIASPIDAYVDMGRPDPARTFKVIPQPNGATTPLGRFGKSTDDSFLIWFDFGDIIQSADQPYNNRPQWEETAVAECEVLDSDGNAVASMTTAADMRWLSVREGQKDRMYLRMRVKAGTDLNEYTVRTEVFSETPDESPYRTITSRVACDVRDVLADGGTSIAPLGTTGWAQYADSTHTSGSPQALTAATRAQWTNDAGTADETYSPAGATLWASDAITPGQLGEAYMLEVTFVINPASADCAVNIDIDQGSDPFGASSSIVWQSAVNIGAGATARVHSRCILLPVAAADMVTNGAAIGITCSTNADIYDKVIRLSRIH